MKKNKKNKFKNRILSIYYNARLGGLKSFGAWLNLQKGIVKILRTSKIGKAIHKPGYINTRLLDSTDKALSVVEEKFVQPTTSRIIELQRKLKEAKEKNIPATMNKTQPPPSIKR